ncbi:hypothetical protein BC835DRAFT_1091504 [Cytidiella melzeri]|nr:hypothetical protein BC835DRAFT_1091504 [Cytidiella melzeri]
MKRSQEDAHLDAHDGTCSCQICTRRETRSSTYWFQDGTIVIKLQTTLYRLYRGKLIEQSTFFAEMLEGHDFAPSGSKRRTIDGVSLYELSEPVSTGEFEALLWVLENALNLATGAVEFPYNNIPLLLRSASVLSFHSVLSYAKEQLSSKWPVDFHLISEHPQPNAAYVLNLAKQYNLPQVRKRALYDLLRSEVFGLSLEVGQPVGRGFHEELRHDDLIVLVIARHKWQKEWRTLRSQPQGLKAIRCFANRGKPCDVQAAWFAKTCSRELLPEGLLDHHRAFKGLSEINWDSLCSGCKKRVEELVNSERVRVWKLLDVWFGLTTPTK